LSGTLSSLIAPPFQRSTSWGLAVWLVALEADVDLLEQGAEQLLAVLVGGAGRGPYAVEVVTEGKDRLFLLRGKGLRACGFASGELGLCAGEIG
jgi:hypothetical protein